MARVETESVEFLLIPGFALTAFSLTIEALHVANQMTGSTIYKWRYLSPDGKDALADNGTKIGVQGAPEAKSQPSLICLFAHLGSQDFSDSGVFSYLRKAARQKVPIAAFSSATYILARAGLLDGYRCTIHWQEAPALRESFPSLQITENVFEADRGRFTCSGGTAALDMVLHLVSKTHGVSLAADISDSFVYERTRSALDQQDTNRRLRHRSRSVHLDRSIRLMEKTIEAPLAIEQIAKNCGISLRGLEKVFQQHAGLSPQRYYMRLRLNHARMLLLRTHLPVTDIGLAAGFTSPSYFSKKYREFFQRSPRSERADPTET